ncbi:hypothetical protein EGW08_014367, partial [Elysia chlorotica]
EHGAQFDEVAVLRVLHLHNAPRVHAPPHLAPLHLDDGVGPDNGEWNSTLDLLYLQLATLLLVILVFVRVAVRQGVDPDAMVVYLI